jgi:hypothetical protein
VKELLAEELLRSIAPHCFLDLVSVYCESQALHEAFMAIPPGDLPDYSLLNLGSIGRRARHAAAGANLMRCLWVLKNNHYMSADALCSLRHAKSIYEALNKVYLGESNPGLVDSIRHFSVSAGLAMIAHAEWRFANTVTCDEALSYWKTALSLGQKSGEDLSGTSFIEMIISYTMCDITSVMGLRDKTTEFLNTATSLYKMTGRQFHYLALGSIWFDLVRIWNAGHGLSQISELDCDNYIVEQGRGGFPYAKNSIRLCK